MSLYYDATNFLVASSNQTGSLKSRVFGAKELKSSPKQVFALVTEASRWSPILAEVVEKAQLMQEERKLTPTLALLLVHDLLLSKSGISAPAAHPLPLAVTRHKARLSAELTKIRVRRGFASLEQFRAHLATAEVNHHDDTLSEVPSLSLKAKLWPHPRWVRINTLKTTLQDQLQTAFAEYEKVSSLEGILLANSTTKVLHLDKHVPNLVALAPSTDLSKTEAYHKGLIILQDKASCFPAYLLDPKIEDGTCLDACAAPGNKTTHLAAILASGAHPSHKARIWACERNKARGRTLSAMVGLAGCQDIVTVKAGQDFLLLDPDTPPWNEVCSLLLDPSCSGSGIVGRDDTLAVTLPSSELKVSSSHKSRKRKRDGNPNLKSVVDVVKEVDSKSTRPGDGDGQLSKRLEALSKFQLKLLLHAFRFPHARRICYSTCSLHAEENEHVIVAALQSNEAEKNGWRLLQRSEQVTGMKSWPVRGDIQACRVDLSGDWTVADEVAEACIRCQAGTEAGTQGFFVAAFTRDPQGATSDSIDGSRLYHFQSELPGREPSEEETLDSEWEGFSDPEGISARLS
ncbi:MAG: hypothetical protein L6R40_001625 [Gallowayella cf. fulva]|nr:MAG: hypothetical protein L6R40_001625 [Xanthomendoza cf. fulva]